MDINEEWVTGRRYLTMEKEFKQETGLRQITEDLRRTILTSYAYKGDRYMGYLNDKQPIYPYVCIITKYWKNSSGGYKNILNKHGRPFREAEYRRESSL